jgi:hypothetical protein
MGFVPLNLGRRSVALRTVFCYRYGSAVRIVLRLAPALPPCGSRFLNRWLAPDRSGGHAFAVHPDPRRLREDREMMQHGPVHRSTDAVNTIFTTNSRTLYPKLGAFCLRLLENSKEEEWHENFRGGQ